MPNNQRIMKKQKIMTHWEQKMKDTPRTQSIIENGWSVTDYPTRTIAVEFAQQLECELNEQRDSIIQACKPFEYWREISECDCNDPLPDNGCLRCDLDNLLKIANPAK